jgi:nucleotide-binding universal stress UspA family protein
MSDSALLHTTPAASVFHPSDFSEASEIAFAHALKIALMAGATLHMLHVSDQSRVPWEDFPGVRETLERWGLIPAGSPRSAVTRLGIDVLKVVTHDSDAVKASLSFLARRPADLVVLAVHQRDGRMRWFQKSVGEPIARRSGQVTLFVPHGIEGFVSRATGAVSLRHILIPIAQKPSPQPAVDAAARFVGNLQVAAGTLTLLHVEDGNDVPAVHCPDVPGWTWNRLTTTGDPVERILEVAADIAADLIVMTTDGPDGFLDALRGTTSARVLNKARCPVASLPVGARLAT